METSKKLLRSALVVCWLGGMGCNTPTGHGGTDTEPPITGTIADAGSLFDGGGASDAGAPSDAGSGADAGSPPDSGSPTDAGGDLDAGSPSDAGSDPDAGSDLDAGSADAGPRFTTREEIQAHLEGKTLLMTGANVPSHPHGYDEDINYGGATQCIQSVTRQVSGGTYHDTSVMGTLRNASTVGSRGECDHDTASSTLNFSSTTVLIENAQADGSCFDVRVVYPAFQVHGRGSVSQDGLKLSMEVFFADQTTGHLCADGAVGARTVTLNGRPFTGNAVQVYTVSP